MMCTWIVGDNVCFDESEYYGICVKRTSSIDDLKYGLYLSLVVPNHYESVTFANKFKVFGQFWCLFVEIDIDELIIFKNLVIFAVSASNSKSISFCRISLDNSRARRLISLQKSMALWCGFMSADRPSLLIFRMWMRSFWTGKKPSIEWFLYDGSLKVGKYIYQLFINTQV